MQPAATLLCQSPTVCRTFAFHRERAPYSLDMSPCVYYLFAKVKEPLRGTRYSTRDELIHAIGRSIRKINNDGRTDGVRRLPNIWQEVINKEGDYIEGT